MYAAILDHHEMAEKRRGNHQQISAVQDGDLIRTEIKEPRPPLLVRVSDSLKRKRQLSIDTEMAV